MVLRNIPPQQHRFLLSLERRAFHTQRRNWNVIGIRRTSCSINYHGFNKNKQKKKLNENGILLRRGSVCHHPTSNHGYHSGAGLPGSGGHAPASRLCTWVTVRHRNQNQSRTNTGIGYKVVIWIAGVMLWILVLAHSEGSISWDNS
jgi:hypothetical protein